MYTYTFELLRPAGRRLQKIYLFLKRATLFSLSYFSFSDAFCLLSFWIPKVIMHASIMKRLNRRPRSRCSAPAEEQDIEAGTGICIVRCGAYYFYASYRNRKYYGAPVFYNATHDAYSMHSITSTFSDVLMVSARYRRSQKSNQSISLPC